MSRRLRMATLLNGKSGFVGKTAASAIAAAAIDGASEYFRIPLLNDESNVPILAGHSNAEVVLYGAGIIGTVMGAFAMLSRGGRLVGGIGSEVLPASIGALVGVYSWENFLAPTLIRNQGAPADITAGPDDNSV